MGIDFGQSRKDLARANQIANDLQGLLDKEAALTDSARAAASSAKESQVLLELAKLSLEKLRDATDETVRIETLRKYGMTLEQYNTLFDKQKGLCALCSKPESVKRNSKSEGPERLAVDHCHDTGRIRGLLCFQCNTAVVSIGDDEESAKRVVEYFESNALKVLYKSKKV